MNENEFKDALDAARFKQQAASANARTPETEPDEEEAERDGFCETSTEDDSDLEIERDRWGRMVVRRNGKVTYWEGKTDD